MPLSRIANLDHNRVHYLNKVANLNAKPSRSGGSPSVGAATNLLFPAVLWRSRHCIPQAPTPDLLTPHRIQEIHTILTCEPFNMINTYYGERLEGSIMQQYGSVVILSLRPAYSLRAGKNTQFFVPPRMLYKTETKRSTLELLRSRKML